MALFEDFGLNKQLNNAVKELGFDTPTPIQEKSFSVILSGKDIVGIAQTGTGKTLAYLLPILQQYKYSKENHPSVLILVPTRELVIQVVDQVKELTEFMSTRVHGVFGGVNMATQAASLEGGIDVLIATPGRLYDLVLARAIQLKRVKKLVIDEVDVMLELGFRPQLNNLFELLPERRQNIMYSATMTSDVEKFIDNFFIKPVKISIAVSGTPLENIDQSAYPVPNFYTKVNLLSHILRDKKEMTKVLVFVSNKKYADKVYDLLEEMYGSQTCIIHSNKSQNYRMRSVKQFDEGEKRILITTDIMARGLDLDRISHVINFDVPNFPENYMHRIGRTGRAEQEGKTILFFTPMEEESMIQIEMLMDYEIPLNEMPEEVEFNSQLLPEERPKIKETYVHSHKKNDDDRGLSFHDKKEKNTRVNLGSPLRRKKEAKYSKPKSRGDKNFMKGKKNKKRW